MPRLPETHHRKMATKNAFQVKKNSAAIAPTWKRAMAVAVPQLTPSSLACSLPRSMSVFSVFMAGCSLAECHRLVSTIAGALAVLCNTSVIPAMKGVTGVITSSQSCIVTLFSWLALRVVETILRKCQEDLKDDIRGLRGSARPNATTYNT